MAKKYMIKNDKEVSFCKLLHRRILNVFLLTPFYFLFFSHHFICFSLSHFSFLICHFSLYNIGCNVLKMKSYENLMQNIRLLQKEVLLLHLI